MKPKRFQPGDVVLHYPYALLGEVVRHNDQELAVSWDHDDEFVYRYAPNGSGIIAYPCAPEVPSGKEETE